MQVDARGVLVNFKPFGCPAAFRVTDQVTDRVQRQDVENFVGESGSQSLLAHLEPPLLAEAFILGLLAADRVDPSRFGQLLVQ